MSTLRELLDDQKKVFNNLVKQQERKYKSVVKTTSKRLDDLALEVAMMKSTLRSPQRRMDMEITKTPAYRQLMQKVQDMDREISKLRADTSRTGKVKGSDTWRLSVNGIDGDTYTLQVHKDATVDMVYKKISRRHGVPPDGLRIVYDGEELQDLEYGKGKFLSEYGVQDQSCLFVVECQGPPPKLSITKQLEEDVETSDASESDTDEDIETSDASDMEMIDASDDSDRKTPAEASKMGRNFWWLSVSGTDGKAYVLKIHKDATVDQLYKKIGEKEGIHPWDLRILYEGVQLARDGGNYLSDYDVKNRGSLCVVERQGPPVHRWKDPNEAIETTDASDEDDSSDMWELYVHVSIKSRCYVLKMHKDAPVDELHQKISEETGIPIYQFRALHRNKRMEFGLGKCLSDYIVKTPSGRLVYVIPPWDPWKQMALITRNTSAPGVGYGSNIWQLFIRGFSGQINIRIHKDATVDKLFEVINYWIGLPVKYFVGIFYGDEKLERGQGKSLLDYNMEDHSVLHMRQRLTAPNCYGVVDEDAQIPVCTDILELDVKGLDGKTKVIHISKDATSDELLEMIGRMFNIPVQDLRILYTKKQLEYGQGKYLSDYSIQDWSTLFILLCLRGGGVGKCSSYKS